MHADEGTAAPGQSDGDLAYAYKPSLMGAPFEFRLAPDALEWRKGRICRPHALRQGPAHAPRPSGR